MSPAPQRRTISGKMMLLVMLLVVIALTIGLYAVLIPMHFDGKERLQEEHRQKQVDEGESVD